MKQEARRTMSEALRTVELPAAAIAVIKEGALKPRAGPNALPVVALREPAHQPEPPAKATAEGQPVPGGESPSEIIGSEGVLASVPSRTRKTKASREMESAPITSTVSASMTVRLPADMPPKLLRAATDRKIARQRPFTQQEIVAEALAQWLSKNGY